jgi:WD40 repeat protein
MAFSSDGHWLTTVTGKVSMDASEMTSTAFAGSAIRVWNLKTQRPVMHVSLAQEGGIDVVSFTSNGDRLVTASPIITPSTDGSVESEGAKLLTWILLPTDLTRTACSLLTRNLSKSEWETFMGTEPYHLTCKGLPVPDE